MKFGDRLWLWGQNSGSHWRYDLPMPSKMTPREGAEYLGIRNICRVVMDGMPEPPFDAESEDLKQMNQVVWSAIGSSRSARNDNDQSDLDETLRQAEKYPNITGAVLDDFFAGAEQGRARHSLASIQNMQDKLHNFRLRPLDLWVVWYEEQLNFPLEEYLKLCDVVTYWDMWTAEHMGNLEKNLAKVVSKTPNKRRFAGCYMWHYGDKRALSISEIQMQLEIFHKWILSGDLEGIIFCSNCCADVGLEAVEWVKNWITAVT